MQRSAKDTFKQSQLNQDVGVDKVVADDAIEQRPLEKPSVPTFPTVGTGQHLTSKLKNEPQQSNECEENISPNAFQSRQPVLGGPDMERHFGLNPMEEPLGLKKCDILDKQPLILQDDHFGDADFQAPVRMGQMVRDLPRDFDGDSADEDLRIHPHPVQFDQRQQQSSNRRIENPEQIDILQDIEPKQVVNRLGQGLASARPLKTPAAGATNSRMVFQQTPSPPQQPSQHTTSSDFLRCREECCPTAPAQAAQDQAELEKSRKTVNANLAQAVPAQASFAAPINMQPFVSQQLAQLGPPTPTSIFEQVAAANQSVDEPVASSRTRRQEAPAARSPKLTAMKDLKQSLNEQHPLQQQNHKRNHAPSPDFLQPQLRRFNTEVQMPVSPAMAAIAANGARGRDSPLSSQREAERRTAQFLSRHDADDRGNVVAAGQDMITFHGGRDELHYLKSQQRSSSQFNLSPQVRMRSKRRNSRGHNQEDRDMVNEVRDDEDVDVEMNDEYMTKARRGPSAVRRSCFNQSSNNSPPYNVTHSSRQNTKHRLVASGSRHNRLPTTPEQVQLSRGHSHGKSRGISAGQQQNMIKHFSNGLSLEFNWKINIHRLSHSNNGNRRKQRDRDSSHRARSDIKSGVWAAGTRGFTSSKKPQDRKKDRRFDDAVSPVGRFRIGDGDDSPASPRATVDDIPPQKRQKTHHTPVQTAQHQGGHQYAAPPPFPMYHSGAANCWPMFFAANQGNNSNTKQTTQANTVQRTPPRKESTATISQFPKMLPNTLSSHDYETMLAFMHQQQHFAASYYMSGWHQHMAQQARDDSSSPSQPSGSRQTKTKTVSGRGDTNAKEGYSSSKKSKMGVGASGAKTSSAASDDDDEDGEEESQENVFQPGANGLMPMHPYAYYPWFYHVCPPPHSMSPLKFYQENGTFCLQNCLGCSSSSKSHVSKMGTAHQHQIDEIIPEESPSKLCRSESQRLRYNGMRSGERGRPDDRSSMKQRAVTPSDAHETSQAKLGAPFGCSPQHTGRMYGRQNLMGSADSKNSSSTEQLHQGHTHMQHWQPAMHGIPWQYMRHPAAIGDGKQQVPLMFPPPFSFGPHGPWGQQAMPYHWMNEQQSASKNSHSVNQRDVGNSDMKQDHAVFMGPQSMTKDAAMSEAKNDGNQADHSSNLHGDDSATATKKDAKSGAKSHRAGAAGRQTAGKRSKPHEVVKSETGDKQSSKKQQVEANQDAVAQSSTKKRVQKANKKEAAALAAQSTPSRRNRSRTAHKGSPGQRSKAEDYDQTFDRPDDLNKTTTQKQRMGGKPGTNVAGSTFFQITPPKQEGPQVVPATADRAQDRRMLAAGQKINQRSQLISHPQPANLNACKDGGFNGMDAVAASSARSSLNVPPYAVPADDSQLHSAQTDENEDASQVPIVVQQMDQSQQFVEMCPITNDATQKDPDSWWNIAGANGLQPGRANAIDESGAGTTTSNMLGYGTQLQGSPSEDVSNMPTTAQRKNKRRPRKQQNADNVSELNQAHESRIAGTQSASADDLQGSTAGQQRKLTSQQREESQRLNDEKIQEQTQKVLAKTMTQEELFVKIALGQPTVTKCKGCKCRKGHCLKRYCECLRNNATCGPDCGCSKHASCKNMPGDEFVATRRNAIMEILRRKFDAFEPKVDTTNAHASGCNCKNSKCLKGYCECFERGVPCTEKCKCIDCRNPKGCAPGTGCGVQSVMPRLNDTDMVSKNDTMQMQDQHEDMPTTAQEMATQKEIAPVAMSTNAVAAPLVTLSSLQQPPFAVDRQPKKPRLQAPVTAQALAACSGQASQVEEIKQQGVSDQQISNVNVLKAYQQADESMLMMKLEEAVADSASSNHNQHRHEMPADDQQMVDYEERKENEKIEAIKQDDPVAAIIKNESASQEEMTLNVQQDADDQLAEASPIVAVTAAPAQPIKQSKVKAPAASGKKTSSATSSVVKKKAVTSTSKPHLQQSATLSNKENNQLELNNEKNEQMLGVAAADSTISAMNVQPFQLNEVEPKNAQSSQIIKSSAVSLTNGNDTAAVVPSSQVVAAPASSASTATKKKKRAAPAIQEKVMTRSMRRAKDKQ